MESSDLDVLTLMELQQLAVVAAKNAGANADAADIGQDTIGKLDGREFDDSDHMSAWVQTVAKNAAADVRRRAKHIEGPFDEALGLDPQSFSTSLIARQKILDLIAELPDKYRAVIELTYYEGLPANEVGERLGYTTATVHKMLSEARSLLRPDITAPPGYEA